MPLFLILVILYTLSEIYIYQFYTKHFPPHCSGFFLLPFLLIIPMMVSYAVTSNQFFFRWMFIIFAFTAVPMLAFVLFSVIGKALVWVRPSITHAADVVGLAFAVIVFLLMAWGVCYGWRHVVVREVTYTSPHVPTAFDGYRMVQISDLHLSTYHLSPGTLTEIVNTINHLCPDVVFFVGDIINGGPEELPPFAETLAKLTAPDGVFSVMGNHDYAMYRRYSDFREQFVNVTTLQAMQRAMGWKLLNNENCILHRNTDSIAVIGVENEGLHPPYPQRAKLPKAMQGIPQPMFKILLSHDPTHWRKGVLGVTDIDLMLAGHTHAMQLRIGNFSPARWKFKEWGGIYAEGNQTLSVCTGTGSNVPFRLGAWPEIVVITLKKE